MPSQTELGWFLEKQHVPSGRVKDLEETVEALRKLADAQRVQIVTFACEVADLKDERISLQTTILGLREEVKRLEKRNVKSTVS